MRGPRWRQILNGKSTGNVELREAVHALREQGVTIEARVTWEDGDAERYVAEAIEHGVDTIIAAGGDGTHWWCANVASGGFGTEVTVETDEGLKKMLGGLAYLVTGISRLGRIDPIQARLQAPDFSWEGGFIALGIGNGRQAGGGQALCPDALVDDGLLDITVIPDLSGEVGATFAALVKGGKQGALEQVATRMQAAWVQIDAPQPITLNLDGEPVQARRFRIACVPARVRMHLPADSALLAATRADAALQPG